MFGAYFCWFRKATLLGLMKPDDSEDVLVYSLGKGNTYVTYRLGGGALWNSSWEFLEDEEKIEVRTTMHRETLVVSQKGRDLCKAELTKCATKMGLGPGGNALYIFGHGNTYYDIWDTLSDPEQHETRLKMQAISFTTCWAGSITTTESVSIGAQYICAAEMHTDHELFLHRVFFSHHLGHVVCSAQFDIEKRRVNHGWRHACKSGQQNLSEDRDASKERVPTKEGKFFFHVCESCQSTKRTEGIFGDYTYGQK